MKESYHPEKGTLLRDLKEDERFMGFYVLRSKQMEPFRDPSKGDFLTLILSDRSGQMVSRVWEGGDEVFDRVLEGEVLKVEGETEIYLERLQIRVLRVRAAKKDEYDLRDMIPSSPRDPKEMLAELNDHIAQIQDPHLSALLAVFFEDQQLLELYSQAPAARRIHHAYLHGLLEHTLETLRLSGTVVDLYPEINQDLLMTGALLHDIGKVREYSWELDIDYSAEGRLLGHVVLTDEMLTQALESLPDFPPELGLRLRHMLLSHHGRFEWGSPRRPQTIEAIALHHIENLSAQVNRFKTLLDKRPLDRDWTDYDNLLRRQLYGGGEDSDLTIEERSKKL